MTMLDHEAPPQAPPEPNGNGMLAKIQEQIREIAGPLVTQLKELDASIEKTTAELKEMREARQQLRAIVKGIDPTLVEPIYKKNGQPKKKNGPKVTVIGVETIANATQWLQDRRDELNAAGGFRAVDLNQREDWDVLASHSAVNKLLGILHEQGVLILDRYVRGKSSPETGFLTGKFYKVV